MDEKREKFRVTPFKHWWLGRWWHHSRNSEHRRRDRSKSSPMSPSDSQDFHAESEDQCFLLGTVDHLFISDKKIMGKDPFYLNISLFQCFVKFFSILKALIMQGLPKLSIHPSPASSNLKIQQISSYTSQCEMAGQHIHAKEHRSYWIWNIYLFLQFPIWFYWRGLNRASKI